MAQPVWRNPDILSAAADADAATRATHSILSRWLQQLHDYLLHKREWIAKEIEDWRGAVQDIQQHWCAETSQKAFPKLHMLRQRPAAKPFWSLAFRLL